MSDERDNVSGLLSQAVEAVEAANVPEDLRAAAFTKAFDFLSGSMRPTPGGNGGQGGAAAETQMTAPTTEDPLQVIADSLGVEREVVDETYHLDDGQIKLSVASRRLDEHKSAGTQQIALLLAAGRQAAGTEQWTATKTIREAAREYGRHDSANFASAITGMDEYFSFAGTAQQRRVRVNRRGLERAAAMIHELRGA
jgi:hypothetical protein